MDWLNWLNDEAEISPQIQRYKDIGAWIDDNIGAFDYFGIRALVKSAADNNLKADYPNIPYTAKDIIEWAEWNDEESFLMTPGAQALSGEKTSDYLFGAPAIDPRTEKMNTTAVKNGVIVEMANSAGSKLLYYGLALGAIAILYQFGSAKAINLAKG